MFSSKNLFLIFTLQMVSGIPLIPVRFNKEMATNNSLTTFGNKYSEVEFIRRVLNEFGLPDEKKMEIDRVITQVKVDMNQDKMNKNFAQKSQGPIKVQCLLKKENK